jgi:GntR family transcriptional regulator, transcriptional repressor for pyruvate dehydrogenase complex
VADPRIPLAQMISTDDLTHGRTPLRSPKTAELVAATLRRMIVDGKLADNDYLPTEAELMEHFGISRPTLREAVRVLESEGLVEVRRGSRTGARVCVPGPEIMARPAALLLELSGATLDNVLAARAGFEPVAARLLADAQDPAVLDELEELVQVQMPAHWAAGNLAEASAYFHRRLVELSGNKTMAIIAGMLHEITVRHTDVAINDRQPVSKSQYERLLRSCQRLIDLARDGDGEGAEAHWRRHMDSARELLIEGMERVKVRDIML